MLGHFGNPLGFDPFGMDQLRQTHWQQGGPFARQQANYAHYGAQQCFCPQCPHCAEAMRNAAMAQLRAWEDRNLPIPVRERPSRIPKVARRA